MLKYLFVASLPAIVTTIVCKVQSEGKFNKLTYAQNQVIIGIIFGILSILGTEMGIKIDNAVINTRNVAPICAGLIFGAPSGIIAGIIGGTERWFAAIWGAGYFTRFACSISTLFAGMFAGIIRKYFFDNKRPSYWYGLISACIIESFHMLLIFLTNFSDIQKAFYVVKMAGPPMLLLNGTAVMLAMIIAEFIFGKRDKPKEKIKTIELLFQRGLITCIACMLVVGVCFQYVLQTQISRDDARRMLTLAIEDINGAINDNPVEKVKNVVDNRHVGETGYFMIIDGFGNVVNTSSDNIVTKVEREDLDIRKISNISDSDAGHLYFGSICNEESYCMYKEAGQYYVFAVLPKKEILFFRDLSFYITIFMEIIVKVSLLLIIYVLLKNLIIKNVHRINKDLSKIANGDLDVVLEVNDNKEFMSLSKYINETVDTLKKYIKEAEERIDKELEFARTIQCSAIPKVFPPFKGCDNIEIYASMNTAKEVGGDFYDFYMLDENHLAFIIADVSGKGISAAMFMMRAKTVLNSISKQTSDTSKILTYANEELCKDNEADMFVTCWIGIIDIRTNIVEFSNAGHTMPVIIKDDGTCNYYKSKVGFVLGGLDCVKYKKESMQLDKGDSIYLYTDGVTEATDINERLYGEERLIKALGSIKEKSPKAICSFLKDDINKFVGEAEQADDITMLCLKILK